MVQKQLYISEITLGTIILFNILEDCTCKSLINKNGYGNCEKNYHGKPICYVNQPTSCKDLLKSTTNPGERISWKACKGNYGYL